MALGSLIHEQTRKVFCGTETGGFGTGPAAIIVAADGLRHLAIDTPLPKKEVEENPEITGNRGFKTAERAGVEESAIQVETPLVGSGAAGTAPDFAPLLKASGFAETINAGVSAVYERLLTPGQATAAWLAEVYGDGSMAKYYAGVVFEAGLLPDFGKQFARLRLTGKAARSSKCTKTTVGTGGITNVATSLPLAARAAWVHNGADFFVEVTDGVNTEQMRVTAVDNAATPAVATVARDSGGGGAFAFAQGATITPYVPAAFTVSAASPITGNLGSFSVNDGGGAVTRHFDKAALAWKSGLALLPRPAMGNYPEGFEPGHYGQDGCVLTIDPVYTFGADGIDFLHDHLNRKTSLDLALTIGNVAGNRVLVDINTAQVHDINAPNTPSGVKKGTVVFRGYSTDGKDFSLTFN